MIAGDVVATWTENGRTFRLSITQTSAAVEYLELAGNAWVIDDSFTERQKDVLIKTALHRVVSHGVVVNLGPNFPASTL